MTKDGQKKPENTFIIYVDLLLDIVFFLPRIITAFFRALL